MIDDGSELFGSATAQPKPANGKTPNGFNALAVFDAPENGGTGNGFIDPGDAIYSKLLLWIDANHDGISQPSELKHLADLDVHRIDLQYARSRVVDEFGMRSSIRPAFGIPRTGDATGSRGMFS